MSFAAMPLDVRAVRTALAEVDALARASLVFPATSETVALSRTASGVTFTVPDELRLIYLVGEVLAWAEDPVRRAALRPKTARIEIVDLL